MTDKKTTTQKAKQIVQKLKGVPIRGLWYRCPDFPVIHVIRGWKHGKIEIQCIQNGASWIIYLTPTELVSTIEQE